MPSVRCCLSAGPRRDPVYFTPWPRPGSLRRIRRARPTQLATFCLRQHPVRHRRLRTRPAVSVESSTVLAVPRPLGNRGTRQTGQAEQHLSRWRASQRRMLLGTKMPGRQPESSVRPGPDQLAPVSGGSAAVGRIAGPRPYGGSGALADLSSPDLRRNAAQAAARRRHDRSRPRLYPPNGTDPGRSPSAGQVSRASRAHQRRSA